MEEKFGLLLSRFRKMARVSQQELANPLIGLSNSHLAMIERNIRGPSQKQKKPTKPMRREHVCYIIQRLNLHPYQADELLLAAGLGTDRTLAEELELNLRFATHEKWIFCRLLEEEIEQPEIMAENILKRKTHYCYFTSTSNEVNFLIVCKKLKEFLSEEVLQEHLECNLLPKELFIANFAIYNPGKKDMFCSEQKSSSWIGSCFFTTHHSEACRRFDLLREWRLIADLKMKIEFEKMTKFFP